MFQGFTERTSGFLWDLSFNNERPWFLEHKAEFETVLNEPFKALAQDTLALVRQRHPERDLNCHVSRIYRDARRLFGRGPYKDHLWFTIFDGEKDLGGPAFFFELGAATYSYGMGFWDASPTVMEAFRRAVDANPARFERMAKALARHKELRIAGPEYKRPKGERGALINPYYNRRYLMLSVDRDFGGDALREELPQLLTDCFETLFPMYDFFWECWRSSDSGEENL